MVGLNHPDLLIVTAVVSGTHLDMAKIGAGMTVVLKSVRLLGTTAELMLLATISIGMSVRKPRLQASGIVEMSLLQSLLQDHVGDGTNLLQRLAHPERCSSPRQVHDRQSAKFGIPTMAG
jgi:hypothetical protein